jgi:hypothetical protein
MARPTKLTDETAKAIIEALQIGATYADAAGAAGIEYRTFRNWMQRGETVGRGKFFQFFHAVERAGAVARVAFTRVIYTSAVSEKDWRAAMEYLKRRDRETWGDSVDVTTKGAALTGGAGLDLKRLSLEELKHLETIVEKASNASGAGSGSSSNTS